MTHWIYRQYIVAFIDVLGQKEKLLKLDHFPKSDEDMKTISQTLRETAGYIDWLRKTFQDFNKITKSSNLPFYKLTQEERQMAEQIRGINDEIPIRFFSDSIIWEIPVDNSDENCKTARQIMETLYSLCFTFLSALAQEKPLRGAVDFGFGVPIGEQDEIYGSALVNAHLLESEIANYPRIVIGNSLWEYLTFVESCPSTTKFAMAAKKFAKDAKSLITLDDDNIKILDIIGEGAKSTGGIKKELVTLAYDALFKIQTKYVGNNNINTLKLLTRYALLNSYFQSRLPIWQ